MKKELTKENLKQYLQDYIIKWDEIIEKESELTNEYSQEMIKQLEIKKEIFEYMLYEGIDNYFE